MKQVLLIPEELALHGVPVDRDNRPMHIGYAFHAAANGGGGTRYSGGMGRAHQLEAQRLVMAQRLAMMREQEDAMLMQARLSVFVMQFQLQCHPECDYSLGRALYSHAASLE